MASEADVDARVAMGDAAADGVMPAAVHRQPQLRNREASEIIGDRNRGAADPGDDRRAGQRQRFAELEVNDGGAHAQILGGVLREGEARQAKGEEAAEGMTERPVMICGARF